MSCRFVGLSVFVLVISAGASAQDALPPPNATALDNDYVRVTRNVITCGTPNPSCEDRVIVSMSDIEVKSGGNARKLSRGQIAVFKAGESYEQPTGGSFYEVAVKPNHPPVKSPPEIISAQNNVLVVDNSKFFIYEERLNVGETRQRHSHSQRVEVRISQGPQLQQWVWREGKILTLDPPVVNWREPVVHVVKNMGDAPLQNFILEFKPAASDATAPSR